MLVALVGNQNCGKTTLFNALTGSSQRVGNFPGVTVDSKIGTIKGEEGIEICDLPGIYSLSPYSNEEIVTRDFIIKNNPDVILNIIDVTNIERNLYLTLQLCELGKPMVIALNMMDEMIGSGNTVNISLLSKILGVSCLPIIASKGEGVAEVLHKLKEVVRNKQLPQVIDLCKDGSPIHRAIHAMMTQISDHAEAYNLPLRYAATHLLEGDEIIADDLHLSQNEKEIVEHMVKEMTDEVGYDAEITMAMMRYSFIDDTVASCVKRKSMQTKEQVRSNKIDKILTNKYWAFPIFIVILGIVFYLTFDLIGGNLQDLLDSGIEILLNNLKNLMLTNGFSQVAASLLCDGLLSGVGSVLTFLPVVILLFFFLSLLEDSGYMARIAFIMDKPLRKTGLSGRSFVPMLVGFGCSVPAVMATRTLTSEKERDLTVAMIPFMPCTAKLPIFTVLCAAFFGHNATWFMILLYVISVGLGVIIMAIIHLITKVKATPFMMELPAYRLPTAKNTLILMWEKAKDFLKKAFTIILVASVIIWFLSSFDYHLNYVGESIDDSLLASISRVFVVICKPMGVVDWEVASAIITGLSAKEAVVSTLEVLGYSLGNMSTLQGFSLLIFIVLYMPCFATFSVMIKEFKSWKKASLYMLGQTVFAYLVAVIIFQIGSLFI